jgi:hypothetical protein
MILFSLKRKKNCGGSLADVVGPDAIFSRNKLTLFTVIRKLLLMLQFGIGTFSDAWMATEVVL